MGKSAKFLPNQSVYIVAEACGKQDKALFRTTAAAQFVRQTKAFDYQPEISQLTGP